MINEKCYKVYIHKFPNNKNYIGITKQKLEKRWQNGLGYLGQFVYNAIKKYGWDNIKHEVLYENLSKEEAEQKEIELISKYKSNLKEFGYNIANGGNCSDTISEETRQKLRLSKLGIPRSKETIEKMRKAKIGYTMSEENKLKMSKRLKTQYIGKGNPFYGKKHSNKTIEQMRQMRKGKNNSNYNKGIPVICIETMKIYQNSNRAFEETNIISSSIRKCCLNKQKTAGGFHWKFYKERI